MPRNIPRADLVQQQKLWTSALKAADYSQAVALCNAALPGLEPVTKASLENIVDDDALSESKRAKLRLSALLVKAQCLFALHDVAAAHELASGILIDALGACGDKAVRQTAGKNARDLFWHGEGADKLASRGLALRLARAACTEPRVDEDKHLRSLAVACADPKADSATVLAILNDVDYFVAQLGSESASVRFEQGRAWFVHGQVVRGLDVMLSSASSTAQFAHAARCASASSGEQAAHAWAGALALWVSAGMPAGDAHGAASADQWAKACVACKRATLCGPVALLEAMVSALVRAKSLDVAAAGLEAYCAMRDAEDTTTLFDARLLQLRVARLAGRIDDALAALQLARPRSEVDEHRHRLWRAVLSGALPSTADAVWTLTRKTELTPALEHDAGQLGAYCTLAGVLPMPTTVAVVHEQHGGDGDAALTAWLARLKSPARTAGDLTYLLALAQTLLWVGDVLAMRGAPRLAVYYWERGLAAVEERGARGMAARFAWQLALLSCKVGKPQRAYSPPAVVAAASGVETGVGHEETAWAHLARAEMDVALLPAPSFADIALAQLAAAASSDATLKLRLEVALAALARQRPSRALVDALAATQPRGDTYRVRARLLAGDDDDDDEAPLDLQVYRDVLLGRAQRALACDDAQLAAALVHAAVGLPATWARRASADVLWPEGQAFARRHRAAMAETLARGAAVVSLSLTADGLWLARATREGDVCVLLPVATDAFSLLDEFADLMDENVATIKRGGRKQDWWTARHQLNAKIENWVERARSDVLGWAACLLCPPSVRADAALLSALAARQPALDMALASAVVAHAGRFADAAVARDGLRFVLREPRGDVEALVHECGAAWERAAQAAAASGGSVALCLGGKLGQLPWEALMPEDVRCSRLPSLSFALPGASATPARRGGFYVVDSRGDLPRTAETMQAVVGELDGARGWTGNVGSAPPVDEARALLESRGVFFFAGHGAAEDFLPRDVVRASRSAAVALLMGCSSARRDDGGGVIEPSGVVDAYCLAGSTAVVGNLWDVTDKDIDRFTTHLCKNGALEAGADVAACVAKARHACVLKWLVGAAPVCYARPRGDFEGGQDDDEELE